MKPVGPLKFAVGVKTSVPAAVNVTTPPVTATPGPPAVIGLPSMAVMLSGSASTSVSLARTSIVTGVSSTAVKLSFAGVGASLVPPITRVTVASIELAPSVRV